ncbi:MAG: hypothetical protein ABF868_04125 [Sporolactobacillus sp.]
MTAVWKKSVCMVLLLLSIVTVAACCLWLTSVKAQQDSHARPLAAVRPAESALFSEINAVRKARGGELLNADWELFQLARRDAEQLAAGSGREPDTEQFRKQLSRLGRTPQIVAVVVVKNAAVQPWRKTAGSAVLTVSGAPAQIGIGCASQNGRKIQVILYAAEGGH